MKLKAFTLVELMIVMAILAILAGMAVSQYSTYKHKAQAKDLVTLAAGCVHEIVAQCAVDPTFSSPSSLENCRSRNATAYLDPVNFLLPSSFSCNRTFSVVAYATVHGTTVVYQANCTYDKANHNIFCSGPEQRR